MKNIKPYLIFVGAIILIITCGLIAYNVAKTDEEVVEVKYPTEDEKYQIYYDNLIKKVVEQRYEIQKTLDAKVLEEALPYFDLYFNDVNVSLLTTSKRIDYETIYPLVKLLEIEFRSQTYEEWHRNMETFYSESEKHSHEMKYLDFVETYEIHEIFSKENKDSKTIEELKGISEEEKYLKKFE